jgi:phage-related protein
MVHHTASEKRLPAEFYRTERGNEPVREWLRDLEKDDRRIIGADIMAVEYGWPIGMPTCRPMGAGLYEVRSDLSGSKRIARVLFCIAADRLVLLHGFIKKTQETPDSELKLAMDRKRKVEGSRQ